MRIWTQFIEISKVQLESVINSKNWPKFKKYSSWAEIVLRFATRGFLGSLISNLSQKFENSKWLIQYGGKKFQNQPNLRETCYPGFFGVAEFKSGIKSRKFKMVDEVFKTVPLFMKFRIWAFSRLLNSNSNSSSKLNEITGPTGVETLLLVDYITFDSMPMTQDQFSKNVEILDHD